MAIGDIENNPLDLKSAGFTWQGETGTYTIPSASGSFVSFDTMADGVRAAAKDLATAIGEGYNTVSSLVYHVLGTSTNNAENPAVSNYLSAVENASGLSGNQTITTANIPALLEGFFTGEGTASGVSQSALSQGIQMAGLSGVSAFAGNNILNDPGVTQTGFINSDGTQAINTIAMNSSGQSLLSTGAVDIFGNPTATASGSSTSSSTGGVLSSITSLFSWFNNANNRGTLATRLVFVILGLLLVSAAIFAFAKINPAAVAEKVAAAT